MASYQIPAIEAFDFSTPTEWPHWIRRFERFRNASGIAEKSEESQIDTLIYSMGDKADDILQSFNLSEEASKSYKTVKERFDTHFVQKRNIIFERAKFNSRKQEPGESVDDFITDLHCLARYCNYGNLHEEMIRDRIVVGIRDNKLSQKMQLEPELTLKKAIDLARQCESVKKQQPTVRGQDTEQVAVAAIRKKYGRQQSKNPISPSTHPALNHIHSCTRCGQSPKHDKRNCPAKDSICHKCHKKGHFKAVCRSKREVREVLVSDDSQDEFLGVIHSETDSLSSTEAPWTTKLELNGRNIEFKIDTGADVTVISEQEYLSKQDGPLTQTNRVLSGPSHQKLEVCGQFSGRLSNPCQSTQQEIYVIRGLRKALLGRPAIEALQVVQKVDPIQINSIVKQFPELFQGLGRLKDNYKIQLLSEAKPFALTTPRRVAVPLLPKVKAELERMEKLGVISKVTTPTEWCAGMVVVPKPNGTVRICVDLTKLNQSVCRERHILPSVEQVLAQIGNAKVFSKLDANSGFWQIELAQESAKLTTFITPYGRFCFNRLPFGITSAPEHFQRRMSEVLQGLNGVVCLVDDILVYGNTKEQHDTHLMAVLQRIRESGLTLSKDKCEFNQTHIKYLGQSIDETGVRPDPDKVRAIQEMRPPTNVRELRQFLGMVNQLSKFLPFLADQLKTLRDLLSSKNQWNWGDLQSIAFTDVKAAIGSSQVLGLYDPTNKTIVSADASSYGLGAVLQQQQKDGELRPIAFISRSLSDTEKRYAQIEKEALAVTWASERFKDYLIGLHYTLETDHKPLVPLLSSKNLEDVPIRVQRFRLRLMRFDYTIVHVPGKSLCTADALSRSPLEMTSHSDSSLQQEVDAYVNLIINNLPATDTRLKEIQSQQNEDPVCQKLKIYCQEGWPDKSTLKGPFKAYVAVASELCVANDLLLRGSRLVIPPKLRTDILHKIHTGHQGITKCRRRTSQSVWWPCISKDLEDLISKCPICCMQKLQHSEPLLTSPLPDHPWQKVATDLFEWRNCSYVLVVDYYSRYIELAKLSSTTSSEVIKHLKSFFSRHGVPQIVVSDNGPQYSAAVFKEFATQYGFTHTTSSPQFPQANGAAERAVRTIKDLLNKSDDPYLAILAYRSTPLENGYSPAELLMGRKLRTTIPTTLQAMKPQLPNMSQLQNKENKIKKRQQKHFNRRHKATNLKPLRKGDNVWLPDRKCKGIVIQNYAPRSYVVQTEEQGTYRRNRKMLLPLPSVEKTVKPTINKSNSPNNAKRQVVTIPIEQHPASQQPENNQVTQTRSGRVSKPPEHYTS